MNRKYLYISAGKGPAECEWVVGKLLRIILKKLKEQDFNVKAMTEVKGEYLNTYKSVQLEVIGEDLDRFISTWIGTIQWTGDSMYRPNHKRKNWFVGVKVIDEKESILLRDVDLKYITYRASGPGGQHRNKVESAVKIIHKPSGLQAVSCDSRSQYQNRIIARKRLEKKLMKSDHQSELQLSDEKNKINNLLIRGKPIRIFKGKKFIEI